MKQILLVLALVTLAPQAAMAQAPKPPEDVLARYLYAPELVLDNQQAINLSDRARLAIQEAMMDAQQRFMGLQFMMSKETETLRNLLRTGSVDSVAVLKQIDQMLGIEREVKRTQMSLMIRIKNTLTPEQQAALDQIRTRGRDQ
jgi:Spy/CpxP family protein refolding chaperone